MKIDYSNGIIIQKSEKIFVPCYDNIDKEKLIEIIKQGKLNDNISSEYFDWDAEETLSNWYECSEPGDEIELLYNGEKETFEVFC